MVTPEGISIEVKITDLDQWQEFIHTLSDIMQDCSPEIQKRVQEAVRVLQFDADDIQSCTREAPHECGVNGPCNGTPVMS